MKHIIGGKPPPEEAQVRTIVVDGEDAGQRLDNFLMRHLKGVPKTHIYRIIRSGEVRINKGRAAADRRVQPGDAIRLPPVRTSQRASDKARALLDGAHDGSMPVAGLAPAAGRGAKAREFPVLFEDDWLLAIDKPSGLAVHGGSGVAFGVIEQLRMARPQLHFLELVHRLDRETSGVLLLAKKRSALKNLQDQFRARETSKTYLALVAGQWPARLKVLDKPLQKMLMPDGERRVRVVAPGHADAMPSLTLVKVLRQGAAFSLLEVALKTGRTHQIRVHLAAEGRPIAGDDKYGDFALNRSLLHAEPPLKRMFLHATRLQFRHPAHAGWQVLEAAMPPELQVFADHATPE